VSLTPTRAQPSRLLFVTVALAATLVANNANAQCSFLGALFGGCSMRTQPDPPRRGTVGGASMSYAPEERRREEGVRSEGPSNSYGRGAAFCVRLCDGRFFPIAASGTATPAAVCEALCPAARTRIFKGSAIDHAVASDGTGYDDLKTAFAYRKHVVPDCSCNGKDPFGLARVEVESDPTLRTGDYVAGKDGLKVVTETPRNRQAAEFTPVREQSIPADLRRTFVKVGKVR
jgi:hypothetical protein